MGILEWGGLGALFLGLTFFCAKIMRNGLTTLDEHRAQYLSSIHEKEKIIHEEKKTIAADEQMLLMKYAAEDLIRLAGAPQGYKISVEKRRIVLSTPSGEWHIDLMMAEKNLRSANRRLHGRSKWILSGNGEVEEYNDAGEVMRSLNCHLHPDEESLKLPPMKSRKFYNSRI